MDKAVLRQQLLKQRRGLAQQDVMARSVLIREKLLRMVDWLSVKNLHIYTSMKSWNEVDTEAIINHLAKMYAHITITTRPAHKNAPLPTGEFDLIIVPVLGFDTHNYRLGLGGGWYDRFLAQQARAQTIGLAYEFAQMDNLPHENHDIALDKIITDL